MITLSGTERVIAEKIMSGVEKPYATDMNAAMEVVGKILERRWWIFDIRSVSHGEGMVWFCDTLDSKPKDMQARFKSLGELPRAICEAALKTIDETKG